MQKYNRTTVSVHLKQIQHRKATLFQFFKKSAETPSRLLVHSSSSAQLAFLWKTQKHFAVNVQTR